MVINVLASSSDTHGDTPPRGLNLSQQMKLVHASVSSSNAIFNSSRTLLPKKMSLTRTTTVSGQLL